MFEKKRVAVIAGIDVNIANPKYSRVLLEVERKKSEVPEEQILSFVQVPTEKVMRDNLAVQDLVQLDFLGGISKIASRKELEEIGANAQEIYDTFSFNDWIGHQKRREDKEELQERIEQSAKEFASRL